MGAADKVFLFSEAVQQRWELHLSHFVCVYVYVCVCVRACVSTCNRVSTGILISISKEGPFLGSKNICQIEKSMCVCVFLCVRACFSTYVRFI